MIDWKFDPNQVEENSFKPLDIGDYRVRIEDIQEGEGQNEPHNPYYCLRLEVNGDNRKLWYYMTFMKNNQAQTNTNLAAIWNSFDIPVGELDPNKWIGKVGACRVKHEKQNGETRAKISYFIPKAKQDKLPPWEVSDDILNDPDFALLAEDEQDIPF